MSNLGDLLEDIGIKNAGAVDAIGDLIGTVADVAGGVGAVVSLIDLFEGQNDQTQAQLQVILDTIKSGFQQLGADLKAQDIIAKNTNLTNQLSQAQGVLASLKALVNQQPPLSPYDRTQQIEICITALQALSPITVWEAPAQDQLFWSDAGTYVWNNKFSVPIDRGYGEQAPSADSNGVVFNYIYVLPVYLQAVFILLAVGASLDPNFVINYGDSVLRPAITTLQTYHDKILNEGLTELSPVPWDSGSLLNTLLDDPASTVRVNPAGLSPVAAATASIPLFPVPQPVPPFVPPVWNPQELGGVKIEYGAVDKFSGSNSMGAYAVTLPVSAGPAPFDKFKLRVLKKAKDLYALIGLYTVWTTINRLKLLVGDPPAPEPSFADWSIRNDVFAAAKIPPAIGTTLSIRSALQFIQNTAPVDTKITGMLSLRALLLY